MENNDKQHTDKEAVKHQLSAMPYQFAENRVEREENESAADVRQYQIHPAAGCLGLKP